MLCNGDFEDGVFATPNTILWLENGDVPCWHTTASDSVIEMWGNGYEGVNAYSGVPVSYTHLTLPTSDLV